jgi:hypothetical protein
MTLSDDGYTMYLPVGNTGIVLLDVSTPNAPQVISSIATQDSKNLVLFGNFGCLADGIGGLSIVNLTDPNNLVIISNDPSPTPQWVTLSSDNQTAFLADISGTLLVYNITDPTLPK